MLIFRHFRISSLSRLLLLRSTSMGNTVLYGLGAQRRPVLAR